MRLLPLCIVTGASGSGKTAVVPELRRLLPDWDVFETDVLQAADWDQHRGNWLRVAHSIAQSGRPTVLCGTMLPRDVDRCDHRPYFSGVHYLNLHCDDEVRAARLRARPAWRGAERESFVREHIRFAHWLLDHATTEFDPPMVSVDTTEISVTEAGERVARWASGVLRNPAAVTVRAVAPADGEWLEALWRQEWGGDLMVTRGRVHRSAEIQALVAWRDGERVGAAAYRLEEGDCELLSLNACPRGRGVGTALLSAVEAESRRLGARRLWLITTNDNVDALRFYQRRGYRLAAVHPRAVDEARRTKPGIPEIGAHGIPVHDEIEMEKALQ